MQYNGMNQIQIQTQKLVKYYDMFTHETFEAFNVNRAKNVVISANVRNFYRKLSEMDVEEKEEYLRLRAHDVECHCHHYNGDGGICTYRTCRHGAKEHGQGVA